MIETILIVEDEFAIAHHIKLTLEQAGYSICGIAGSVAEARQSIAKHKPSMVLLDIHLHGSLNGVDLARELNETHTAFVFISANFNEHILEKAKATQPYGFLIKPFRDTDLLVTVDIARYRHQHSLESKLRSEIILQNNLATMINANVSWQLKLERFAKELQAFIPFDYIAYGKKNTGENPYEGISFLRIGYEEYQMIGLKEFLNITGLSAKWLTQLRDQVEPATIPGIYNEVDFTAICRRNAMKELIEKTFQMRSNLEVPITLSNGATLMVSLYSKQPAVYTNVHLALLVRLQQALRMLLDTIFLFKNNGQAAATRQVVPNQTVVNKQQKSGFENIIGNCPAFLSVLDAVHQVAPFNTSVLLLGESGTGKEVVAQKIHDQSPRSKQPIVKVNCAALPPTLIESELFGYEKGAFTGAVEKRSGKFELANGGTIFLDEIGEIPPSLQVKLLRVLQEKEIERIGGQKTIKVDVRIIAATNKDLEREVAAGRFRLDLYYRLNVYPINLPPLRERRDDIPLLAKHFLAKASANIGITATLAPAAMDDLLAYHWPGNVRELEHVIERNIIANQGKVIERFSFDQPGIELAFSSHSSYPLKPWEDHERDYIVQVLKACHGRVSGKKGAAAILNIPPSTLESKMRKLGIRRETGYTTGPENTQDPIPG